MGLLKMLHALSRNNRFKWPFAQKGWIRSILAMARTKPNPGEAMSRGINAAPVSLNAHNLIARCAHGRAHGPLPLPRSRTRLAAALASTARMQSS